MGRWKPIAGNHSLAIGCLCECRHLERIESAARHLIRSVIAVFKRASGSHELRRYLSDELCVACRELGSRWPGRDELLAVAVTKGDDFSPGYGADFWPDFVANVTSDRQAAEQLCSCARSDIRRGAFRALAEWWPDERTRELLTERVRADEVELPRIILLRLLTEKWPDERTRELLTERALADPGVYSRIAALQLLVVNWPYETTRELLTERAIADDSELLRHVALSLTARWLDERTRELLTERAVADEGAKPRGVALESLTAHWPDERTRELLTERAVADEGARAAQSVAAWNH